MLNAGCQGGSCTLLLVGYAIEYDTSQPISQVSTYTLMRNRHWMRVLHRNTMSDLREWRREAQLPVWPCVRLICQCPLREAISHCPSR